MKTSPLDPEVPAQPLSQCLELPLPVACTGAVVGNTHHDGNETMWWKNKQEEKVEKTVV